MRGIRAMKACKLWQVPLACKLWVSSSSALKLLMTIARWYEPDQHYSGHYDQKIIPTLYKPKWGINQYKQLCLENVTFPNMWGEKKAKDMGKFFFLNCTDAATWSIQVSGQYLKTLESKRTMHLPHSCIPSLIICLGSLISTS